MEQKYFLFVIYFTLINWLVRHGSMDIMDFYIEHLKHIGVLFYSLGKVYISNIIYKHFYFYFNVFYFFKLVLTPPFIDWFIVALLGIAVFGMFLILLCSMVKAVIRSQ